MIEAIKRIGKSRLDRASDGNEILKSLLEEVPRPRIKKGEPEYKLHIVTMHFDTLEGKVELDSEEINETETANKYLWLGNLKANKNQIYSTSTKVDYLLSQVLPNLSKRLPEESNLYKRIKRTISNFFCLVERSGRNQYIFNIERLGSTGIDNEKLRNRINAAEKLRMMLENEKALEKSAKKEASDQLSEIAKEMLKEAVGTMEGFINRSLSIRQKEIGLYTLMIDHEYVSVDLDYKKVAYEEKIESLFEEKQGNCSLCNEHRPVTDKPQFTGKALGYYITNIMGFSSEISGDFMKSLIICQDCYKSILCGEVFVRTKLRSKIGGLDVHVIPKFLFAANVRENLENWASYIKNGFNAVKSLEGLKSFREKLEEYRYFEEQRNNFFLDLLFYKQKHSEFKILKLIKDVPPSRFEELTRVTNEVKDIGDSLLGESKRWHLGLGDIYHLIPLRQSKIGADLKIEYKKILELYGALFSGDPISYGSLIKDFIELARIYLYKKFDSYSIWKPESPDFEMVIKLLGANLLLLYLRRLRLLKGGNGEMNYDSLSVGEEMKSFLREMDYDEAEAAMFLLGCLIGAVGNAQYRESEGKSKPILEKITYQGMNSNKIIRLTNDVFEKLTQYKSRGKPLLFDFDNEVILSECKRLMDKTISSPLSDQENVFYVLSGYAYRTRKAMTGSKEVQVEQIEEEEHESK